MTTPQVLRIEGPSSSLERGVGIPRAGDQPGYVWRCRVFFDELDAMGMLHNARYAVLLERAASAFFEANGWQWDRDPAKNPDAHHVVVEQTVSYLAPIRGATDVCVEIWVDRLGRTSATFGFEIRSHDSEVVHARAQRATVKLDPVSFEPVAWTPRLRRLLEALVRDADR